MKRILNIATLMVSFLILLTGTAFALSPVSQDELKTFTGQAGMTVDAQDILGINWDAERIVFGDDDGTDGTPAFLCLNDIEYAGRVTLKNAVSTSPSNILDPFTGKMSRGMDIQMDGAIIEIDRYHIDSITIEGAPGSDQKFMNAGKSFGSITIEGFYAEISGNIRISSK